MATIKYCLVVLAVLLVPMRTSAAVSDGTCVAAGDVGCWTADYNDQSAGDKTTTTDYHDAGTTYTAILGSNGLDYGDLPEGYREEIWLKFIEAEGNDGVLSTGDGLAAQAPDVYATEEPWINRPYYTLQEAEVTLGAKVAHAFWLHVNSKLPWDFSDIEAQDPTEFQYLFKPDELFDEWAGGAGVLHITFIDHSPKEVYDAVITAMGGLPFSGTEMEAWEDLLMGIGKFYHHSSTGDSRHAVTFTQSQVDKVSRGGCGMASSLITALARSINIPSRKTVGWTTGVGHVTAFFYGQVRGSLWHGDDIYGVGNPRRGLPGLVLDDVDWIEANVTPMDGENTRNLTLSRKNIRDAPWFFSYYDTTFCALGWDSLKVSRWLGTTDWQDAWRQEFTNRTGCDGEAP
jgi:hypothetical protein